MSSNRIAQLTPPPRQVPLSVVCSAMLGSTGGVGAGFLIVGLLFVWLFVNDLGAQPWVSFTFIVPIIGVAFFVTATVRGLRCVILLRYGALAGARRVSERTTDAIINDQTVIDYIYEFQAGDGRLYKGVSGAVSSGEIGDESMEPVLYLPSNPRQSVLVDALPLRFTLDVDETGEWLSYEGIGPVVWFVLAWAGFLAHVLFGLYYLLGAL